jgi:hypothetical protein
MATKTKKTKTVDSDIFHLHAVIEDSMRKKVEKHAQKLAKADTNRNRKSPNLSAAVRDLLDKGLSAAAA